MIYNKPQRKKGETWVMNENINFTNAEFSTLVSTFDVRQNRVRTFKKIKIEKMRFGKNIVFEEPVDGGVSFYAYEMDGWNNGEYGYDRTITFLEPPTGDLLTWLQENAVKQ